VEHFWLYNDRSSDDWEQILAPHLAAGIVEIIDWPVPAHSYLISRQIEAYQDALTRGRHRTRWLALIDLDEYLLPREDDTITDCLGRHFSEASAVYVNWRNFGTGNLVLRRRVPILSRITVCSEPLHPTNTVGKTIVRPDRVRSNEMWNPHHVPLVEGATYFDGDGKPVPTGPLQPELDGQGHAGLIRLNHYQMRDEGYFRSVRLGRIPDGSPWKEGLAWEHRQAFSEDHDYAMVEFLRDRHPEAFRAVWARPDEDWPELGPFVSARLLGGLGNNLFQIATASALAWDHGAEPVFPDLLPSSPRYTHVLFRCNPGPDLGCWTDWGEPVFSYSEIPYQPNLRLGGYFQSERYFGHHHRRLRALFRPSPQDARYLSEIYGWLSDLPYTVGVQIRYYRDEDPTGEVFPQYGTAYLERAAARLPGSPLFVLSSNDLEYARSVLPERMEKVVVLEGEEDYIDFFVLSSCRHQIITNSSYGWWAAWLNPNPGKIVIRPEVWLNGHPCQDVCPPEWISVDAPEESSPTART
jgi:hypothetical protein